MSSAIFNLTKKGGHVYARNKTKNPCGWIHDLIFKTNESGRWTQLLT